MCFAPQRRALFWHLNFQKWSEPGVFGTFWLRNCPRATASCNFSSRIWPHGSAPDTLASLLFDPPESQINGKTQWIATLPPFRPPASSVFWLFLFFFSDSSHLCFSICPFVHIVGSLTSKLPSTKMWWWDAALIEFVLSCFALKCSFLDAMSFLQKCSCYGSSLNGVTQQIHDNWAKANQTERLTCGCLLASPGPKHLSRDF